MFFQKDNLIAELEALKRSQAVIEFTTNGVITFANDKFLSLMGYELNEIVGKHHSIFVSEEYKDSEEYSNFWKSLRSGEYFVSEFERFNKEGKTVWIQASYNPVINKKGDITKIIKYASDITKQKMYQIENNGQIGAIYRSLAVIEFDVNGNILNANDNFLHTMGYTLDEIKGYHHSIFIDPLTVNSLEYKQFWKKLGAGEYIVAEFQRFGKNNKEIWIQASYNPIIDMHGKVIKVIKYATDITAEKVKNSDFNGQINAINKSQAVIEFSMDGIILKANEKFLNVMGYEEHEVVGKHHSIFVTQDYKSSKEYSDFWEALRRGEYSSNEYSRVAKGGKKVWIQASYNPILDTKGRPFKVVKYAADITTKVEVRRQSEELAKSMYTNIESITSATSEMKSSINEISKNMVYSSKVVNDISSKTEESKSLMDNLQKTSTSMEAVVELIKKVAEQVNLLSLNATIEAARAGESGKGFGVVANEIKALADQVGKATDDINMKIANLQDMSNKALSDSISTNSSIGNIGQSIQAIAVAIEEQGAVLNQIVNSMQNASEGISKLNSYTQKIANFKYAN